MGYTHYWYKLPELDQDIWFKFAHDFVKVLPHFYKKLDTETEAGQKFFINGSELYMNGIGEESHETFHLTRKVDEHREAKEGDEIFACCKTAEKEYDIAVCCALLIAKKHFGTKIKVSSDGSNEEWQEAKDLCQDILKYGKLFDISYETQNEHDTGVFL